MPRYINKHSLQVGPITDLMGSKVACVGLGNAYTRLLGYVVIWVQVDGVLGYNEDQIALVILDFSNFATRVPVILGTPIIGQVVNVMKEAEMDALAMPWVNARAAHLLAVQRMTPMEVGNGQEEGYDTDDDNPLMYTQKAETLGPFSSHIIPVKTVKVYSGECINVMVHALCTQDGTLLPGLTIQNTCTEMRKGSKKAAVVVWNNTAYPQTLRKKTPMDNTPFKEQLRQIPLPMVEEVRNHLREMLESGAIRPSQSTWCNAVVLVRKKDGGLCFCIDFCCLNAHTKKDSYPLPRIQEALESLVGAGHFSCLDLKSGFWQIRMDEMSKKYIAFTVGNLGFFECDRMPFGLCNALATFQCLMQNCMGELNYIYCLIYLDDLIIVLQMAEEHLHQLHVVFDHLREYNLKLKPSKCSFFREEINYLAHQVSK